MEQGLEGLFMDGSVYLTLDPKGRVIIPARYREMIGDVVAIRRGDGCLYLYPQEEWNKEKRRLLSQAMGNTRLERKHRAVWATTSSNLEIDKQGRLLIPQAQRQYAGLDREIVISGYGNRLEIWDTQRFETFIDDMQSANEADLQSEWEAGL